MTAINKIINEAPHYCCEGGGHESIGQKCEIAQWLKEGNGRTYLGNAFSLQMIAPAAVIGVEEVAADAVPGDAISVIGHKDTAAVVSGILGREIPCNRVSIHLEDGDTLYVAQVMGGRLPEGATTLPEGVTIAFRKVVVRS